jgi:transposase-like protein
MKIYDFDRYYPDEDSCRAKFKEMREAQGVVCPKCGCKHHYWLAGKSAYQCSKCKYRQSLRANTVMHGSKLPFRYWFIAMHLLTSTKHTFSALELQRQLEHKRYQPVWELLHKLRSVMGTRDSKYTLSGCVEVDEGYFSTEAEEEQKEEKLKAGAGSQKKTKVVVMAESMEEPSPKNKNKPRKVKHIKMIVIPDLKADTIDKVVSGAITEDSTIVTDASSSHVHFKNMFKAHESQVINPKDIGTILPWVHIAISNAKSLLADTYHGTKKEFLQGYLNEFCYKFNRRYFGLELFDRLLVAGVTYQPEFKHIPYRKAA